MGYLEEANQKSPRQGAKMEISETLSLPDICILFWEDDNNLPKDGNVNIHLMKMACFDTLSGLFRVQKIKVDLLEEIVLQTPKFRFISLNLSYPQSRHLQPNCSPQASIRTRHIDQTPTIKGNLGNSHCKRLHLAEYPSLQSPTVVVSIMVRKSSFMYGF